MPVNATLGRGNAHDKSGPGEKIQTLEIVFQLNPQPTMSAQPTLSILQYNIMKSQDRVMPALLRDRKTTSYDVLTIQEP